MTITRTTTRRRLAGSAAALTAATLVLAACSGGQDSPDGGAEAPAEAEMPNYVPVDYVEPDFPSVNGSTAGYTQVPAELVDSVTETPGTGETFTLLTPIWQAIPPVEGNEYFEAINERLGSTLEYQMVAGNDYNERLATILASPDDVPDWVSVFGWNPPPRFDQAVEGVFQDLTEYIAGDAIEAYPNLANLPTEAWQFGVFNGRTYGVPVPGELVTDALFYRADILAELGLEPPETASELLEVARAVTDPAEQRWAFNDPWVAATLMFGVPPKWQIGEDGELIHRYETEEYRAALEFVTQLYSEGLVHPDAVADNSADAKQRFESGNVVLHYDGVGGWAEMAGRISTAFGDDEVRMLPLSNLHADDGEPVRYPGNPANFFSFFKKSDDPERIEELLRIANFFAAPFGTTEYNLVQNGVEGVHYTVDENGAPQPTEQSGTEIAKVTTHAVAPPVANTRLDDPTYVENYTTWMAGEAENLVETPFYAQQIVEPAQFATLGQPFSDLEKDIARGRQDISALDTALENWRTSGGDELRAFYQDILDNQ
ncbi:extracellular solute-binding protein [Georgenia faecalis]|uniref:extracellular solute-binding protein n=1 Tax=Georgenia faecalis TaxID=2483799 RepID=UPI000FD6FA3F|nr:extracellular solute-binding protein [Georgenia faecalis]